jgi:hypothetical protein
LGQPTDVVISKTSRIVAGVFMEDNR